MKNLYSMLLGLVLILPASQARQQALAFRVDKYLPAMQQTINDASIAGDMSVKIQLPDVPWKDYGNIKEYLQAAGYSVQVYGQADTQALIVRW